jgi:hypothetical protein
MIMKKLRPFALTVLAAGSLALVGCVADESTLVTPAPTAGPGGTLFERYVSLGNSIAAGMQSGGINDSTQLQAFPVLLAQQAGGQFHVPLLNRPGCPPPMAAPLGPSIAPGVDCAFRATPAPPFVQNLAVPGVRIAELLQVPPGALATLNTVIVGNRSQVQAMQAANPTLVSAWVGNNDALAAAISGNVGLLTPMDQFQQSLAELEAAIKSTQARDVILMGPVDAVIAAPILQPGAFFFAARDGEGRFFGKPVNANCSPITNLGQLNPLARNMVSFRILADDNFPEINCDPSAYPQGDPRRGIHLLDTAEQAIVRQRINEYNEAIRQRAEANGWIFVNPTAVLAPYLMDGPPFNYVRKCQMLATATTPLEMQQAVVQSCPVPPNMGGAPNLFGSLISFDGVHPSALAHRVIANALITAINTKHTLQIPLLP